MLRVAVIQGGPSSEAEVSRVSAACVEDALTASGYTIVCLELDPTLPTRLQTSVLDVVFPVVHGALGEDGALQGMCEVLGLPYVGSGVLASALAFDKAQAKRVFRTAGLPVAADYVLHRNANRRVAVRDMRKQLGPAMVIKPCSQGSAIGVTRLGVDAPEETLLQAIEIGFQFDDTLLCERLIMGTEITCGVTDVADLGGPRSLLPTEIRALGEAEFYDFHAKYAAGGSEHICPARLPPPLLAQVQEIALAAHKALECRDLSRADFIVGDGEDAVTLLEVNTMPGMTPTSLYPEAMAKEGVSFAHMCSALVKAAAQRKGRRRVPVLAMP